MEPESGDSSGHIDVENRLAAGAVDERGLPAVEGHGAPGLERRGERRGRFRLGGEDARRAASPGGPRPRCRRAVRRRRAERRWRRRPGRSSRISRPTVPLPAMNRSSSNGWTKVPVIRSPTAPRASSRSASTRRTTRARSSRPAVRVPRILVSGAVSITSTDAFAPTILGRVRDALRGVAGADGPDAARKLGGRELADTLKAPRILNEPIGCSTSSFR